MDAASYITGASSELGNAISELADLAGGRPPPAARRLYLRALVLAARWTGFPTCAGPRSRRPPRSTDQSGPARWSALAGGAGEFAPDRPLARLILPNATRRGCPSHFR
jgi:hypothetical protein